MKNDYLTKDEKFLFSEGTWQRSYEKLGAHPACADGNSGYEFAVWAPGAVSVRVAGDFNGWDIDEFAMFSDAMREVWHIFIPGVKSGDMYKYVIETKSGEIIYKADPYAFCAQCPPETASRTADIDGYKWTDSTYLALRKRRSHMERPLNIYEVHFGSWKRRENGEYLTYAEMTRELVPYVLEMGYTHIELMPMMEHPFDGSWGYQITGYYAPTSRYGSPDEFMSFVNACHKAGIGVILDWVPGHFCRDSHGLASFTGNKLYEKEDHAQWGTYKFDFERGEVRSFLISNALFWIEKYHIDGIRVDGVTSMLYLNFGVEDPKMKRYNEQGTEENMAASSFLRLLNRTVGEKHPDVMMIAEESTAWPLVTYPPDSGGLGFHYKWDMGWMHDTLNYMKTDFPYKPGNHNLLTFSMMYAFNENFVLALSHDEVVHGKCSLIGRMPGDYWRKFGCMRALALYQMCHPGAKLNFMGSEFAQFIEWRYDEGLEWFLIDNYDAHRGFHYYVKSLNAFFKKEKALWQNNYSWEGFRWIDADNSKQSILIFERKGKDPRGNLTVLINFTPATYRDYRIGVPKRGYYAEVFSSDRKEYGGAGMLNEKTIKTDDTPWHGEAQSVKVTVPPIGGIVLKYAGSRKQVRNSDSGRNALC